MNCRSFCAAVLALLTVPIGSHGQSLGEIARQQKNTKSQKPNSQPPSTPKKVYTDENIGKSESTDDGKPPIAGKPSTSSATEKEKSPPTMSAEQWRAKIRKKKDLIAAIQERIDKLQASVNYVQNNRNVYTNAPEYNEHQHQKQLAAEQLKGELEQQKSELSDLQEQARQQGFGNSIYQ